MKNKNLTLIILAAGIGTRYGGLKQLDSVTKSGETILDFSIYDAIRAGFNKIIFLKLADTIERGYTIGDAYINN